MEKYKVNEIFTSLQGEGSLSGLVATFVRFAGCNLKCPWCDTKHEDGIEYSFGELVEEISKVMKGHLLILTGGEPTIQNLVPFLTIYKQKFPTHFVSIETNGTNFSLLFYLKKMNLIDFITVSPKTRADEVIETVLANSLMIADEVKVVMAENVDPQMFCQYIDRNLKNNTAWIQPCSQNFEPAINFVMNNPLWRLGIQAQKVVNIR